VVSNTSFSPLVLQLERLSVTYRTGRGHQRAVDDISLQIMPGEALGLVGESGSGKSSVALAALRHLPRNAEVEASALKFQGREMRSLRAEELRRLRGDRIAAVYQNPGSALNPSLTIGRQITETIERHRNVRREEAIASAAELLRRVRIGDPEHMLGLYPHELSGGMQQRANIAIAIALDPALLILDEPTTALDASVQSEIIGILNDLRREHKTSVLLISHDINLVRRCCDRVAVMQTGSIVESGNIDEVLARPRHGYTRALIASIPTFDRTKRDGGLADKAFSSDPPRTAAGARDPGATAFPREREAIAAVRNVRQSFGSHTVLCDVDLKIGRGETYGLIGESGSGKSTLARILTGLQRPTTGTVELFGKIVAGHVEKRKPDERRNVQMVFQSPDRTLNPRHTIGTILGRPLRRLVGLRRAARGPRIADLLESVRLSRDLAERKPGTLSGGQRQRAAIARAFSALPKLVVLDEPTSALDVSVQATVLDLLNDLQREKDAAYLFISHDLRVVRFMADRIGVLYRGRIVEEGSADQVFNGPNHPYTEMLLAASFVDGAGAGSQAALPISDTVGTGSNGCAFANRCSLVQPGCRELQPRLAQIAAGHSIACWQRGGSAAN
jgi:peptide/nickel transport system ATP-binding protein